MSTTQIYASSKAICFFEHNINTLITNPNANGKSSMITRDGFNYWFNKEGFLHRDGDLPAIEPTVDNVDINTQYKSWYKNGKRHRDGDLPAVENYRYGFSKNDKGCNLYWYKDGLLHRDGDQPAIIKADGCKRWYQHGELHRDGDLPALIRENGNMHWYKRGRLFRENGLPTIVRVDDNDIDI
jgi:hypothetical protein